MKSSKMKATICTKYGSPDVLNVQEVNKPTPKNNELLIKVYASSVTAADTMMRKGSPYIGRLFLGLTKPKHPITGTGFAGEVEAIGADVKLYKKGDYIFGESIFGVGTNAEYLCVAEDGVLTKKPNNMTFEEVASVCDGPLTSLNFLKRMAKIKKGQKVLINGASGSLGTAAIQLAKYFGAEVTGVCSTTNVDMVKNLGADEVIDYKTTDFTKNSNTYDVIYDTVGKRSFSECKNALTKEGIYLSPVLGLPLLFQLIKTSIFGTKKAMFDATGTRPVQELKKMLGELKEIMELGHLKMIIGKKYRLTQISEAHRYVDTGRKKGNIVVLS